MVTRGMALYIALSGATATATAQTCDRDRELDADCAQPKRSLAA